MELVDDADRDKNGKIDFDEWEIMGAWRGDSLLSAADVYALQSKGSNSGFLWP